VQHVQPSRVQSRAATGSTPTATQTPSQMSSAAFEPATTFRPYHFPPAPRTQLPPAVPAQAADQPLFQSSAVASIQLPRTSAAPVATQRPLYFPAGIQAPIRFSAVAPRAAATHRHAQLTVDPPASGPKEYKNFHRSSLTAAIDQGRQALPANPPAPAGFEPQQPSSASLPASIQPQEPEEVYFDPGPDPVPAPRRTSGDLVNRRSGGGADFRTAHDNTIARHECHEKRLVRDLAAIYRAHIPHPQSIYSDNRNPFVPPAPAPLSLSPRATYYLFTQNPAYTANAAPQPQYHPRPTNPLPFYSYWGPRFECRTRPSDDASFQRASTSMFQAPQGWQPDGLGIWAGSQRGGPVQMGL
jgi:hypothetical protein